VNALSYANASLSHGVAERLGVSAGFKCVGTVPEVKETAPVYPPDTHVMLVKMGDSKRLLLKPRYYRENIGDCAVVFDISEGG
jgi:hypothetical protein